MLILQLLAITLYFLSLGYKSFELILVVPIFIAEVYLLNLLGFNFSSGAILDTVVWTAIPIILMILSVRKFRSAASASRLNISVLYQEFFPVCKFNTLLFSILFLLLYRLYSPATPFPSHDGIVPINIAKIFAESGNVTKLGNSFAPDVAIYPPGLSIFLAAFWNSQHPIAFLCGIKVLTILILAITPFVWGWWCRRSFKFNTLNSAVVSLIFVVSFYVLDRNLLFATAIAGKDSQLFASVLFPVLLTQITRDKFTKQDCLITALATLGCCLAHYSMLYMLVVAGLAYVTLFPKLILNTPLLRGAGLIGAGLLFYPRYLVIKSATAVTSLGLGHIGGSFEHIFNTWIAFKDHIVSESSNLLFIPTDLKYQWNYKGLVLLVLLFSSWLVLYFTKLKTKSSSFAPFKVGLFGCIAGFISIYLGIFQGAGLTPDYARWFSFNFIVLIFVGFLLSLLSSFEELRNANLLKGFTRDRRLFASAMALFVLVPSSLLSDVSSLNAIVTSNPPKLKVLRDINNFLKENVNHDKECRIVAEGHETVLHIWLALPELEYAGLFSKCIIENGSWFSPPLTNSRTLDGYPSLDFLKSSSESIDRYFIMSARAARRYEKLLTGVRFSNKGKVTDGFFAYTLEN